MIEKLITRSELDKRLIRGLKTIMYINGVLTTSETCLLGGPRLDSMLYVMYDIL